MRVRLTMPPTLDVRRTRGQMRRGGICRIPARRRPTSTIDLMDGFRVTSEGPLSRPLTGTVHVGGAKNSALKLMAAALLAPGRSVITNVPDILDVEVMA